MNKKIPFFKRVENFLKKYQNIISLLFGLFGIAFGFYKGNEASSYKDSVELITTTLDSTRDANGVLVIEKKQTILRMKDMEISKDSKIRELFAELNKSKNKTKIVKDTVLVSYIQKDTIVKIIRDTIVKNTVIKDTIKDTLRKRIIQRSIERR